MQELKHTTGPWNANWTRVNGLAVGFHVTGGKHGSLRPICEFYDKHGTMSPEEIDANARLIAAAPELLEALIRMLPYNIPLTGNPSHQALIEHWEYEKSLGSGEAEDQLFMLEAISNATDIQSVLAKIFNDTGGRV